MSSFTRYAAVAAVVLSLGFLVASAPTPSYTSVPAITGTDAVSLVCAKFFGDIEVKMKALLACVTVAELKVVIKALVVVFQTCAKELLQVGADVHVAIEAQASIVACVAAILTASHSYRTYPYQCLHVFDHQLLAQICVQLTLKFGVAVVVALCAELDACLKLVLVNLNICVDGILALVAKATATTAVVLLAQINFKACLSLLGLGL